MVGPGEVDSDLEPEVREECQTKYGDVHKVIIFEIPGTVEEEAVRIFVEFKRMEAAIKGLLSFQLFKIKKISNYFIGKTSVSSN